MAVYRFVEHWDFWRPEGDPLGANLDAYYPKVNFDGGRNAQVQTRYIQNGAYIRMKTSSWDILCRKHGLRMPVCHRYVLCICRQFADLYQSVGYLRS